MTSRQFGWARGLFVGLLLASSGCAPLTAEDDVPPGDPIQDVSPEQLFAQGVRLAQRGDLTRSEQYLSAAMTRGAPVDEVLPLLLRVCIEGSRLRSALGYAQEQLQAEPTDWSLRYVVASLQRALGKLGQAERNLLRVIGEAPEEPSPHYLLAMVQKELGLHEDARARLTHYLALAPAGEHAASATEALAALEEPREMTPVSAAPRLEIDGDERDVRTAGQPASGREAIQPPPTNGTTRPGTEDEVTE